MSDVDADLITIKNFMRRVEPMLLEYEGKNSALGRGVPLGATGAKVDPALDPAGAPGTALHDEIHAPLHDAPEDAAKKAEVEAAAAAEKAKVARGAVNQPQGQVDPTLSETDQEAARIAALQRGPNESEADYNARMARVASEAADKKAVDDANRNNQPV